MSFPYTSYNNKLQPSNNFSRNFEPDSVDPNNFNPNNFFNNFVPNFSNNFNPNNFSNFDLKISEFFFHMRERERETQKIRI